MKVGLLLLGLLLSTPAVAVDRGHVVVAELHDGRVIYQVEARRVDLEGAVDIIRDREKQTGVLPHDDVAIIVASTELSIRQVQELYSTLQAYGFTKIHIFAFHSDKTRLQGLDFAEQVIPFTTDREELMK